VVVQGVYVYDTIMHLDLSRIARLSGGDWKRLLYISSGEPSAHGEGHAWTVLSNSLVTNRGNGPE
jgi:hypothetical protein